ncbi:MAG: polymer-forming cytoskeletal protein [Patescibacteria group bacterium]
MVESVDTVIGLNVNLKGNLKNQGSIQVNGSVEGEVRSDDNITVGETAMIKGPVAAKVIEVSGTIKGLIEASEKLEINPTGKVIGDINAKSLIIKQGAIFIGKSAMPDQAGDAIETKDEKPEEEPEEEKSSK